MTGLPGRFFQRLFKFLFFGLALRLDCNPDNRLRKIHAFQHDKITFFAQGIAGGRKLQSDDGTDITSLQLCYFLSLVGMKFQDLGNFFLFPLYEN